MRDVRLVVYEDLKYENAIASNRIVEILEFELPKTGMFTKYIRNTIDHYLTAYQPGRFRLELTSLPERYPVDEKNYLGENI